MQTRASVEQERNEQEDKKGDGILDLQCQKCERKVFNYRGKVTECDNAIQCDKCERWHHIGCLGI